MGQFGWGADTFTNDYTFGDYTFDTAVTWGGWVAEQGENPADCFNQSSNVSNLVDSGRVDGTITDGAITEGAVESGTIDNGKVTPTGPIVLSVNGHQLG